MSIAEQIYVKAQALPEELARKVLDYACDIEAEHGASAMVDRGSWPAPRQPRAPGSAVGKLKVLVEDDEHLEDFQDSML